MRFLSVWVLGRRDLTVLRIFVFSFNFGGAVRLRNDFLQIQRLRFIIQPDAARSLLG